MPAPNSTVLLIGGSSGIGLAFGRKLLADGHKVIFSGRRLELLQKLQKEANDKNFLILKGDVATAAGRIKLHKEALEQYSDINILILNSGIQQFVDVTSAEVDTPEAWAKLQTELDINVSGPIHLSMLFIPHLSKQKNAIIVNTTSGLSFLPLVKAPIYSSTKAALHSYTWSLRAQLKDTGIKVVELAPPAVQTDLNAPGLHDHGVPLQEFTDSVYAEFVAGKEEIAYGMAQMGMDAYRKQNEVPFNKMNGL